MFLLQPLHGNDDDKNRISEGPPPIVPSNSTGLPAYPDAADVHPPQGDELFQYVLHALDNGSSKKELRTQLIAFGYTAGDAEQTVEDVDEWRRRNPVAQQPTHAPISSGSGNTNMIVGGLVCLLGLAITIGTFMASADGGGRFTIAYGAVIFGAIQFFRGLSQSNQQ